jgi:chromosome segregation ATPase
VPRKPPPPEPPWQVILEDMRSQNRATLEAVQSFEARYARDRVEDRTRNDARFDTIEEVLREHTRDIREIRTDVGQLKTDVAELKTDVAVLKTDVAVLKTDVAELKTDVAVLKTDVAAIKADLQRVEGKVDHQSALEPRVAALERSK